MDNELLRILLLDQSRCAFGTEHNIVWGAGEKTREEIITEDIGGISADIIELSTPLEMVEEMNRSSDLLCGYENLTTHNWQAYVREPKLEITCGDGPFITNTDRSGFLDRKLWAVNEFCIDDWAKWTKIAYRASYGYEIRGDRLFLARRNLLRILLDYWQMKFPYEKVDREFLKEIAMIISWNVFQMDGVTGMLPGRRLFAKVMDWGNNEVVDFVKINEN